MEEAGAAPLVFDLELETQSIIGMRIYVEFKWIIN
jgi:hypothetical protein